MKNWLINFLYNLFLGLLILKNVLKRYNAPSPITAVNQYKKKTIVNILYLKTIRLDIYFICERTDYIADLCALIYNILIENVLWLRPFFLVPSTQCILWNKKL